MYLGTIYKLRRQDDMHTWSEKYQFLSTFVVEILSTHIHTWSKTGTTLDHFGTVLTILQLFSNFSYLSHFACLYQLYLYRSVSKRDNISVFRFRRDKHSNFREKLSKRA